MSGPLRRVLVNGEPTRVYIDDTHLYGGGELLTGDATPAEVRGPLEGLEDRAEAAPLPPARRLACACCGAETWGRPWANRDTGYGVCLRCADAQAARYGEGGPTDEPLAQTTYRLYGRRGVHFGVPEGGTP